MGGLSRGEGNRTPHSEFNVDCNPEATSIVFEHCTADKLIVVPFETTTDHNLPWSVFDEIFDNSTSTVGFIPCGAYAVAYILHPKYVQTAKMVKGSIYLAPDEKRGVSVWADVDNDSANVTLVTDIDLDIFVELMRRLAT